MKNEFKMSELTGEQLIIKPIICRCVIKNGPNAGLNKLIGCIHIYQHPKSGRSIKHCEKCDEQSSCPDRTTTVKPLHGYCKQCDPFIVSNLKCKLKSSNEERKRKSKDFA